jgi:hypothetical protein
MVEGVLMSGIDRSDPPLGAAAPRALLFLAPLATLAALAIGIPTNELTQSRLWSAAASITMYIIATVVAVNIIHFRSQRSARMYLVSAFTWAGVLMIVAWSWLGSETELSWLGEISEDIMKYIGFWPTSADGPLFISLFIWIISYLSLSIIAYFLGEALYDARH